MQIFSDQKHKIFLLLTVARVGSHVAQTLRCHIPTLYYYYHFQFLFSLFRKSPSREAPAPGYLLGATLNGSVPTRYMCVHPPKKPKQLSGSKIENGSDQRSVRATPNECYPVQSSNKFLRNYYLYLELELIDAMIFNRNLNALSTAEALQSMNPNTLMLQSLLQLLTIGGGGVGMALNNNLFYSLGSSSMLQPMSHHSVLVFLTFI